MDDDDVQVKLQRLVAMPEAFDKSNLRIIKSTFITETTNTQIRYSIEKSASTFTRRCASHSTTPVICRRV